MNSILALILFVFLYGCQSSPTKQSNSGEAQQQADSDVIQVTVQGKNSDPIASGGSVFFVSRNRATHEKSDIYVYSPKGIRRITFQNADIESPIILKERLYYFSNYRTIVDHPNPLFLQDADHKPLSTIGIPMKRYQLIESSMSGDSISRTDLKFDFSSQLHLSPSKKSIAYTIVRKGLHKIVQQNLKTGRTTLHGSANYHATDPTFSGEDLVWVNRTGTSSQLILKGRKKETVLANLPGEAQDLNWHAKLGLLFSYKKSPKDLPQIYSWNGGCLHQISDFPQGARHPASPDSGTELYFVSVASRQIFRSHVDIEFECHKPTLVQESQKSNQN